MFFQKAFLIQITCLVGVVVVLVVLLSLSRLQISSPKEITDEIKREIKSKGMYAVTSICQEFIPTLLILDSLSLNPKNLQGVLIEVSVLSSNTGGME